jgi:hypothetical protein
LTSHVCSFHLHVCGSLLHVCPTGGAPDTTARQPTVGPRLWKSSDRGRTWQQISRAVKDNPIELPDERLAALADAQIMVSADGGTTWAKLGPTASLANDITYSDQGKCSYA